jgi:cation diffusion facilitator CzcD-associated flavoprotein CzcO
VAVIGAGISGINTAYRLHEAHPSLNYTIFESRAELGGTWSFFKYPGLRSDSDLFSFGFEWNPWESEKVIAEADSILTYLHQSIRSFGGDKHLEYDHRLDSLNWSSEEQLWALNFSTKSGRRVVKARWVVLGTGYYDYSSALPTVIPGLDHFKGQVVHPQFWPEDLDLTGKKVAIVGSGATAITILPNISPQTESVTIIQRSPSYIQGIPSVDPQSQFLKRYLPSSWANRILRIKYLLLSYLFFTFCQTFPRKARSLLASATRKELPKSIPFDPHFIPKYSPWDQRLCACPDGDFFVALRSGKAKIVTGHIECVTEDSIRIKDQPESTLAVDVIVTATGLKLLIGGGAKVSVNGKEVVIPDKMMWKGCMIQDVPNLIAVIGYTNASWTLGADVAAKNLVRLLAQTQRSRSLSATPRSLAQTEVTPFMKLQSTYLLKGRGHMPKAGTVYPWLPRGSYFGDMWDATWGDISKDIVSLKLALKAGGR